MHINLTGIDARLLTSRMDAIGSTMQSSRGIDCFPTNRLGNRRLLSLLTNDIFFAMEGFASMAMKDLRKSTRDYWNKRFDRATDIVSAQEFVDELNRRLPPEAQTNVRFVVVRDSPLPLMGWHGTAAFASTVHRLLDALGREMDMPAPLQAEPITPVPA